MACEFTDHAKLHKQLFEPDIVKFQVIVNRRLLVLSLVGKGIKEHFRCEAIKLP